ncbi:hypothetical protein PLICRDRAFT_104137 [Plicaturopsis crispa FD-325 SS-3]|nr:hypothetical protein PLICRDRAFT_104137 [Plicaturopsis crispa FD-325 SS-3]
MDHWRITVLGDHHCGKTALIDQTDRITSRQVFDPTLEEHCRKQIEVDKRMSFIELIDAMCEEEYASLRDQWIREGQAAILVYSVTSRASFERVDALRQDIIRVKPEKPVFVLVGTKCDLVPQREVSHDEGAQLARTFGCEFMETSAKTGENVHLLFSNVVRALRAADAAASQGTRKRRIDMCTII